MSLPVSSAMPIGTLETGQKSKLLARLPMPMNLNMKTKKMKILNRNLQLRVKMKLPVMLKNS